MLLDITGLNNKKNYLKLCGNIYSWVNKNRVTLPLYMFMYLGIKTNNVNNSTEDLIDAFNAKKEELNMIFNRVTEYLSENQFGN